MQGTPQSIFITVPPEKLTSHRCLLRLWVGVLLTTVMRRKRIPKQRTLFVLDEAAQLGTFDPLLSATTLLRGFGLQLVMVWQDLAQIKSRFPADWATIVNNSAALLSFGFGHYHAAKEYSEVLGLDPGQLASLKPEEAVLAMRGDGTRKISRVNYLLAPRVRGDVRSESLLRRRAGNGGRARGAGASRTGDLAGEGRPHPHRLEEIHRESRKEGEGKKRNSFRRVHAPGGRRRGNRTHLPPGIEKKRQIRRKKVIAASEDSHAGHAFLRTIAQQRGGILIVPDCTAIAPSEAFMAANYTAIILQHGEWWIGWVEEVPGVNSQGHRREELLENLHNALEECWT